MDDIVNFAQERIEKGSKSFTSAARFFDPQIRASVYMLYCWCRFCDDEIDGQDLGLATAEVTAPIEQRLSELEYKTRCAMTGDVSEPEFIALSRVMDRHDIPSRLPLEHLAGFAMDAAGTRYRTLDDTLKYCWHVAGAVGVMMAMVMSARHRNALIRASDLGIAFQLTNIARDVVADAQSGRVYLPEDWLATENIRPENIAARANRDALHRVTMRLLDIADQYYDSATYGLAMLPPRASVAISAARSVYRSIGVLIRRRGSRAWDQRAIVGSSGKAFAVLSGAGLAAWSHARNIYTSPPPRQNLYLPAALSDL